MTSSDKSATFLLSDRKSIQVPDLSGFSVCCCCLELAWKQCLWKPYKWMEREEIFGEMLQECFGILFPKEKDKRYICAVCITQLRTSLNFRHQVLTCRQLMLNNVRELQELPNLKIRTTMPGSEMIDSDGHYVKIEDDDCLSPFSESIDCEMDEKHPNVEYGNVNDVAPIEKGAKFQKLSTNNGKKEDKENDIAKDLLTAQNITETKKTCSSNEIQQKNVTSKMKNGRTKAKKRTFKHLTRIVKNDTQNITSKRNEKRRLNYLKPRLNLCVLLENSTLVPFKANKGCFFCFYCDKQFAMFEECKQHTRARHADVTFNDIVKRFFRPERVRADASDINCKICRQKLDNVASLVEHLSKKHHLKFSDHFRKPVDCIIPYDLSDGRNRCSVCKKEFIFFKMLSKHMNDHTTNYVCPICGKCFLLPERLQTHKYLHISGPPVECGHCGKKIQNNHLLRAHIRNVHNKTLYGCTVCDLKFRTFRERLAHLDKSHGMKVTNVKCEHCDKTFGSPQTLYAHVKYSHLLIRGRGKFECDTCSKVFGRKTDLAKHMLVHTQERNFQCPVCLNRYARRSTLTGHLRIHQDDRRWACRACGAAFVQKCSLHTHIRAYHKEAELMDLVVCRKRNS